VTPTPYALFVDIKGATTSLALWLRRGLLNAGSKFGKSTGPEIWRTFTRSAALKIHSHTRQQTRPLCRLYGGALVRSWLHSTKFANGIAHPEACEFPYSASIILTVGDRDSATAALFPLPLRGPSCCHSLPLAVPTSGFRIDSDPLRPRLGLGPPCPGGGTTGSVSATGHCTVALCQSGTDAGDRLEGDGGPSVTVAPTLLTGKLKLSSQVTVRGPAGRARRHQGGDGRHAACDAGPGERRRQTLFNGGHCGQVAMIPLLSHTRSLLTAKVWSQPVNRIGAER